MSLKFYIIFASVLLIAFSAWSAPVADNNANSGFVEMPSLKNNATRRDAHPNPESSKRDDADMQKLS
ncbi:hypothetical protein F8M41_014201 [Gigaspora margarita]|uniref:Uncharacterized protein n=1 Tax=Gigaspora margarita TaxID=4874 RepID=A0A8H4EUZ0_GIGMA|nr:hypothetical protein F8M41_014201 [Gigaspora margarita]